MRIKKLISFFLVCSFFLTGCSSQPEQRVMEYNNQTRLRKENYIQTNNFVENNIESIVDFLIYYKEDINLLNLVDDVAYENKDMKKIKESDVADTLCYLWNIEGDAYDKEISKAVGKYTACRSEYYNTIHTEDVVFAFKKCKLVSKDLYMLDAENFCYVCKLQGSNNTKMLIKIYIQNNKIYAVERILKNS